MAHSRPRSGRSKPSRRERRMSVTQVPTGAVTQPSDSVRVYDASATSTTPSTATISPRRSYLREPAPIDYSDEYRFIRRDLIRIFIWASLLVLAMFALWLLPVL